jgi:RNA polymerase sigma factor for flagellar operon FliA
MARAIGWFLPAHAGVELDDLVGSGTLGLVHAVRRFDARKCAKVEHYASIRIRGAILDSLRGWDTASRSMRKMGKIAEQACRELEAKLGCPAQESDVAGALGISLDRWRSLARSFQAAGIAWRLCGRAGDGGNNDLGRVEEVAEDGQTPFDACYRREQSAILERALGNLPEREREILSLYYHEELTQKEIAARFHICEARVSQLHGAALTRLRTTLLGMVPSPKYLL